MHSSDYNGILLCLFWQNNCNSFYPKATYKLVSLTTSWWRHQMETFSALLAICVGNSPVPGEFPTQRPVTRRFDVFFDLRLNKRLSKQWWGSWFETLSRPLWRHRNVLNQYLGSDHLSLARVSRATMLTYRAEININVSLARIREISCTILNDIGIPYFT